MTRYELIDKYSQKRSYWEYQIVLKRGQLETLRNDGDAGSTHYQILREDLVHARNMLACMENFLKDLESLK